MLIFEKELTQSERERHWIRVPVNSLSNLPSLGEVFKIKVKSGTVNAKIDRYYRLLGIGLRAFDDLSLDKTGSVAVLEKTTKEEFVLKSKRALT
jgi:hypothetical protein